MLCLLLGLWGNSGACLIVRCQMFMTLSPCRVVRHRLWQQKDDGQDFSRYGATEAYCQHLPARNLLHLPQRVSEMRGAGYACAPGRMAQTAAPESTPTLVLLDTALCRFTMSDCHHAIRHRALQASAWTHEQRNSVWHVQSGHRPPQRSRHRRPRCALCACRAVSRSVCVWATLFAAYLERTGDRQTFLLSTDSRRFHAASFNAAALDRDCGYKSAAPDVVYDVSVLTDGMPATLADTVEHSPMRCAILRSKQAKCAPGVRSAAPDVYYNADTLNKASLATSVKESPVRYGNMRCSRTKRGGLGQGTACSADIGPGTYDFPQQHDVRTSLLLNQNPLSRCDLVVSFRIRSAITTTVHCQASLRDHDAAQTCQILSTTRTQQRFCSAVSSVGVRYFIVSRELLCRLVTCCAAQHGVERPSSCERQGRPQQKPGQRLEAGARRQAALESGRSHQPG